MSLSTKQLAELRHDITSLADIKYDHLTDELLDHYATLTEENMATGLSFYEASTAAFLAMGNGGGIQQIQDDYEEATREQVKARYREIVRGHFHWPTVVTTLIVGTLLLYIQLFALPANLSKILRMAMSISPVIVIAAAWIPYLRKKDSRHRLTWEFITENGHWPINVLNGYCLASNAYDFSLPYSIDVVIITVIVTAILFQSVCLAQLTRETFYFKPNFQR
ncbi:hypothetical protein [Fibrella aquatica]|uniref:hypothetical protein n=1 Tax=Fibrella aquatica TaxID=3242487 RepID=UPI003520D8F7